VTFVQAVLYFLREASVNLVRSWKVSILAVLTIAVSLFLGGVFLLVATNLSARVGQWRSEAKLLIYLKPEASDGVVAELEARVREPDWVTAVERVSAQQARERFREQLPGLADLVSELPPSLEVSYRLDAADDPAFGAWVESLRDSPASDSVDDDRDWLAQLEAVTRLARWIGLILGVVLLGAAVFTIASVIRLTAYLYRDEISIMRLVGATEFFIRGPFWVEGFLQGLLGGVTALGGLWAVYRLVLQGGDSSLVRTMLSMRFLSPAESAAVVLLGGLAGLAGAVVSLRRELPTPSSETPA
jgi:cell division transport system permease protein